MIMPGYHGSYPNFFFEVPLPSLKVFVDDLHAVSDADSFQGVVRQWGVRRTNPRFWAMSDWLQRDFAAREPVQAGLLDLNRYQDP